MSKGLCHLIGGEYCAQLRNTRARSEGDSRQEKIRDRREWRRRRGRDRFARPGRRQFQDVVLVIREKSHPLFRRDGNNLIFHTCCSLADALCGFKVAPPPPPPPRAISFPLNIKRLSL